MIQQRRLKIYVIYCRRGLRSRYAKVDYFYLQDESHDDVGGDASID